MKSFIKRRIREVMIDDIDMNKGTETICNKMTINSYQEAIHHVKMALKGKTEAEITDIMQKIHAPLENLKHQQIKIGAEIEKTGMSGDSVPDEADTYWSEIQTALCDAGPDFKS